MGEKGVTVGVGDDMGEGMQCADHPFRNNPGGICAFCLQEKLGKLVTSSKSNPFLPIPPPSSSSSPPSSSFRSSSDVGGGGTTSGVNGRGRTKIPFLSAAAASQHHHKKKKKKGGSQSHYNSSGRKVMASSSTTTSSSSSSSANNSSALVLKRSKSVAPRPLGGLAEVGSSITEATTDSPRKKSFWSFLYLSSSAAAASTSKRSTTYASGDGAWGSVGRDLKQRQQPVDDKGGEEEEEEGRRAYESQASSSFGRKVSRSRSVGCGSRSFSGDFLERISSGFGDCTLRRVESQREAKPKTVLHDDDDDDDDGGDEEHQRVKCGGLFGMISSSSSSSSYWLSDLDNAGRMSTSAVAVSSASRGGVTPHGGRSRNWGWASFASPMRAFRPTSSSKPSAPTVKTLNGVGASGNSSGKIGSNPSLLAVGS